MNFLGLLHKTFFSLRGINADNCKWARWARLACSGSQSEPSIHFILPMGTASYIIKYTYFPMPLSWAPFSWTWQRYSWNFWDDTQNSKHKHFNQHCGDTLKCFKHQTGMLVSILFQRKITTQETKSLKLQKYCLSGKWKCIKKPQSLNYQKIKTQH